MKPRYLLDTVLLLDHLNGIENATTWLSGLRRDEAVISVITRAEVLVGISHEEERDVKALLATYSCLPPDSRAADRAADLRRQHRWKLPDAFQAALAMQYGLQLATRNTKDFLPRQFDFVTVPYQV